MKCVFYLYFPIPLSRPVSLSVVCDAIAVRASVRTSPRCGLRRPARPRAGGLLQSVGARAVSVTTNVRILTVECGREKEGHVYLIIFRTRIPKTKKHPHISHGRGAPTPPSSHLAVRRCDTATWRAGAMKRPGVRRCVNATCSGPVRGWGGPRGSHHGDYT